MGAVINPYLSKPTNKMHCFAFLKQEKDNIGHFKRVKGMKTQGTS